MIATAAALIVDTPAAAGVYRYRFDDVEFDEAQGQLWRAGRPMTVERLPLQVLATLLRRPGEVVSRAELFAALWQDRPTVEHVLANAISKLRRALGDVTASRLVTLPRVGYRWDGPVERVAVGRQQPREAILSAGMPVPGRDDFILTRPLGEGASSAVWLARHRQLKRTLVFKFARDGEELAALKREYTVCRLLVEELGPRVDLVEVKESNFTGAPFYLVYEDAGIDLRTWTAGDPRFATLDTQQRIELFLKIARPVAAAHSVGVLHRDVKPGNVLIDLGEPQLPIERTKVARAGDLMAEWQVRLIDFGSSDLLTPDRLAALGITVMGMTVTDGGHPLQGATPNYLAPELLSGHKFSTGSDLYALGLMLFQILVGDLRRPLATGWENDIADPLLVDDVRAATEGRPERRLASVGQLIERLETLEQRRAQCEEAAETLRRMNVAAKRLEKIRSRRPWMLAITVCIALGGICAAWFAVRAGVAQRQAEQATARARAINDFLTLDVLQSPDAMRVAANRSISMLDVLARASDRAAERSKDDVQVLAQVRRQLGDIYLRMFFSDQAEFQYRRAITLLEPSAPSDDAELLAARFGLAEALTERDRPADALAALAVAERAAGTAAAGARSSALAQRALRARVKVLMDDQRHREALPFALRLVRLSDEPSEDAAFNAGLRFDARQWLCEIHLRLDDKVNAAKLSDELEAPPFNGKQIGETIFVRTRLQMAKALIGARRLDEAETALTELRDGFASVLAENALQLGMVHQALFDVHNQRGEFEKALRSSEAALTAFDTALGPQHSLVTLARIDVALSKLNLGTATDALRELEAARLRLDANGRYGAKLLAIDLGRSRALTELGRPADALELLEGLNPGEAQGGGLRRSDLFLEVRAETGRALIALGKIEPGRAAVADAVSRWETPADQPWKLERYQALLAASPAVLPRRGTR